MSLHRITPFVIFFSLLFGSRASQGQYISADNQIKLELQRLKERHDDFNQLQKVVKKGRKVNFKAIEELKKEKQQRIKNYAKNEKQFSLDQKKEKNRIQKEQERLYKQDLKERIRNYELNKKNQESFRKEQVRIRAAIEKSYHIDAADEFDQLTSNYKKPKKNQRTNF